MSGNATPYAVPRWMRHSLYAESACIPTVPHRIQCLDQLPAMYLPYRRKAFGSYSLLCNFHIVYYMRTRDCAFEHVLFPRNLEFYSWNRTRFRIAWRMEIGSENGGSAHQPYRCRIRLLMMFSGSHILSLLWPSEGPTCFPASPHVWA